MRIAVPAEPESSEHRVAATPDTVKRYLKLNAEVVVQSDAGKKSGIYCPNGDAARKYADQGFQMASGPKSFTICIVELRLNNIVPDFCYQRHDCHSHAFHAVLR